MAWYALLFDNNFIENLIYPIGPNFAYYPNVNHIIKKVSMKMEHYVSDV